MPAPVNVDSQRISQFVYTIRGKQVMLDADLAQFYQVETRILNRNVARNADRFPEDFRFQLSKEEFDSLTSQIGMSNDTGRGGRRYLPYAYTEQGISMLASVLRSETAIRVSIAIMRAFVEMRHFIANNSLLFERISAVELRQLAYQKETDNKLDQIFDVLNERAESNQKIFFDGQIYDAFSLLTSIVQKATDSLILVDGYVDIGTLNILAKKQPNVRVDIYTSPNTRLTADDVKKFNRQYPTLAIHHTNVFHDRFLILDRKEAYHIGASLKDAGKKCFAITHLQEKALLHELLAHLKSN